MAAWTVIAHSTTVSSAMLEITGLTLTSYKAVRGIISDVTVAANNLAPVLQFYLAGSLITTGYRYVISVRKVGTGSSEHRGSGEAVMWICDWNEKMSNNANAAFHCDFQIADPAASGLRRFITNRAAYSGNGTDILTYVRGTNAVDNTGAVTGFRLKTFDGAGISTGRLTLLGLS